ncbi:MAG TPA: hypothetical protein VFB62_12475 [Polyangiaceae bacterium]|nr:hypothetical protein [Polyangiaceae bacterium]
MRAIVLSLLLCACSARSTETPDKLVTRCPPHHSFDGRACRKLGEKRQALRSGMRELTAFRPDRALVLLGAAKREGPYRHADHVALYQSLGIAHAYRGEEQAALAAFAMLLALSPGHAISYTLSPRATFLFERARRDAKEPPEIRVSWPRDLEVSEPVPIELEVVSDPPQVLRRARLYARKKGSRSFLYSDLDLPRAGAYRRIVLPPIAPDSEQNETLELMITVYDARGNETLLWGTPKRPRSLPLRYDPPTPWYENWWVWGIAGTLAAIGTGVGVFFATQDPPDHVDGTFHVE